MVNLRAILVAAALAALVAIGWNLKGVQAERDQLRQQVADQQETLKLTNKVTTVTSEVLSARVQSAASIKTKAKDVQVEIHKRLAGAGCHVPADFRLLHNAAAAGEVPQAPSGTDGATSTLEEAASVIADNYEIHHDTADRLSKLQQWVKGVSE